MAGGDRPQRCVCVRERERKKARMRVEAEQFYNAYNALREDASSRHAGGVSIFASDGDCDSICAMRILERLLELDSVRHSRFAVSGYEDLQKYSDGWQEAGADEPRAVVLINCGGGEDVRGLFGLDNLPATRVFIVDAHRPLHHRNLDESEAQVLVFQDKDEDGGNDEVPGLSEDERSSDDDDEDDDEDDEEEDDEEEGNGGDEELGAEERRRDAAAAAAEGGEGNASGRGERGQGDAEARDDADEPRASVRRRVGEGGAVDVRRRRQLRNEQRKELRRRRAEYYSRGSFYGMAAGCLVYELASRRLHKDESDLLWLAILSLTDQYVHQRISHERYTSRMMTMEQRVQNLAEGLDAENLPPPNPQYPEDIVVSRVPEIDTIRCEEEYRFMLLRHASLLDAMVNSTYIASKMKTWSDSGKELLLEILARVGLPLKDCRQKYTHMPPQLKRLLDAKLPELADAMQLDELRFTTFRRSNGYKAEVSAVDVVHAVTALLEQSTERKESAMERSSNASRALVSSHDLEKGIHWAMRVQRAIIQYGGLSLARGDVHAVPGFFYVNLSEATAADAKLLVHPLTLSRLATFLQQSLLALGRTWRPIVVIGPEVDGNVTIVGMKGRSRSSTLGNPMGIAFRSAAERSKARFSQDRFDACVIQVARDDVDRFMRIVMDEHQANDMKKRTR